MYCILMLCTNTLSVSACVKVCAGDVLACVTTVICQLLLWPYDRFLALAGYVTNSVLVTEV